MEKKTSPVFDSASVIEQADRNIQTAGRNTSRATDQALYLLAALAQGVLACAVEARRHNDILEADRIEIVQDVKFGRLDNIAAVFTEKEEGL